MPRGQEAVLNFLRGLHLAHLYPLFAGEEMDLAALRMCDRADLREIGVKLGPAVSIVESLRLPLPDAYATELSDENSAVTPPSSPLPVPRPLSEAATNLPVGWEERVSLVNGRNFYYHKESLTHRWEKPIQTQQPLATSGNESTTANTIPPPIDGMKPVSSLAAIIQQEVPHIPRWGPGMGAFHLEPASKEFENPLLADIKIKSQKRGQRDRKNSLKTASRAQALSSNKGLSEGLPESPPSSALSDSVRKETEAIQNKQRRQNKQRAEKALYVPQSQVAKSKTLEGTASSCRQTKLRHSLVVRVNPTTCMPVRPSLT
jgi:hypothetical protein